MRPAGRRAAAAREPESADAAYQLAVKRLARQPQSRAMLRQRLLHAGYSAPAVEAALDRAQGDGYLNDREFAASLVRRRVASRGQGMIAQELRAKGVEEWAAEPALAQMDPEAETERALAVGRTLLKGRRLADGEALLNYLAPRLSRRGFASGLVYRVCRSMAAEWAAARLFDADSEHN